MSKELVGRTKEKLRQEEEKGYAGRTKRGANSGDERVRCIARGKQWDDMVASR